MQQPGKDEGGILGVAEGEASTPPSSANYQQDKKRLTVLIVFQEAMQGREAEWKCYKVI